MKHIFFKVQTIPQTEELEIGSKEFNLYKEKYREYNKLENDADVVFDYYDNAGKNPLWGKIYSISLGFVDENTNVVRIKVFKGSEKDILQEFLNTCNEHFKASKIVGYNLSFLLPFLRSRMLKNGMKIQGLPEGLVDIGKKAWTMQGICLQDMFNGIGWFKNSLEELAFLLNLETNFINGKDVYLNFLAGKEEELNQSIIDETFTLINCYRIIQGEEPCKDLNSTVVVLENVKEVEVPLLERLYNNNQITLDIKNEVEGLVKKKKPSKKEKEQLFTILRGVYVRNNFELNDQDSKKVIEQKENEIKALLKL
ncbi:hypothetical protein [Flavobacterium sp.]|jgi:hypothetical protein|uniref:hypothetical protein n=1 Tax=Flavobacterium sp. TaxID=239 RepID=UPI0037C0A794